MGGGAHSNLDLRAILPEIGERCSTGQALGCTQGHVLLSSAYTGAIDWEAMVRLSGVSGLGTKGRIGLGAALGALAVLAVVSSLAWACTTAAIIRVQPGSGPAGGAATVSGASFVTGEAVQLRWDSPSGPLLGVAIVTNSRFSQTVTIPEGATPGVHYIRAVAPSAIGGPADAFTVQATAAPVAPPATGGNTPAGAAPGAPSQGTNPGTPSRGQSPGAPSRGIDRGATGGGGERVAPNRPNGPAAGERQSADAGSGESGAGRHSSSGGSAGGSDAPGVVKTRSGRVFGQSLAPSAGKGPSPATPGRSAASAEGSATGDLWSGFASAKGSSLNSGAADAVPSTSPGVGLIAGMGILGLGLVALAGGFLVAAVRRRRRAESQNPWSG